MHEKAQNKPTQKLILGLIRELPSPLFMSERVSSMPKLSSKETSYLLRVSLSTVF